MYEKLSYIDPLKCYWYLTKEQMKKEKYCAAQIWLSHHITTKKATELTQYLCSLYTFYMTVELAAAPVFGEGSFPLKLILIIEAAILFLFVLFWLAHLFSFGFKFVKEKFVIFDTVLLVATITAWYLDFFAYDIGKWGSFLRLRGVLRFAQKAFCGKLLESISRILIKDIKYPEGFDNTTMKPADRVSFMLQTVRDMATDTKKHDLIRNFNN